VEKRGSETVANLIAHDDRTYEAVLTDFPRAYKPWLAVDEMILRAMSRSGASEQEIAERLGRPPLDVRNYRCRLGV
jgi:DNA-binding CsgD family transcriptional regulator